MYAYFSEHVIYANALHVLAGFGLAVVLQQYLKGNAFVPVLVGWLFLAIALVGHLAAALNWL